MFQFVKKFIENRRGVAAIEFAMTLPILILFLAGSVNFGHAIYVKHTMQSVAGETMRTVSYGLTTPTSARAEAIQKLNRFSGTYYVHVWESSHTKRITVTIWASADGVTLIPFPLASPADYMASNWFRVQLVSPRIVQFDPSLNQSS